MAGVRQRDFKGNMSKFSVGDVVWVIQPGGALDCEVIGKVTKIRGGYVGRYFVEITKSTYHFWKVGVTYNFSPRDLDSYKIGIDMGKASVYNKFKVGDWVRTTDGTVGEVYDLDYKHVLFTDERGNSRRHLYYNLTKTLAPPLQARFKVGDRVRLVKLNGGESLVAKVGAIATITRFRKDYSGCNIVLKLPGFFHPGQNNEYYVNDSHIELVEERDFVGKRTFKLLKDLPNLKKGALFQEECEDGTQPYSLINNVDVRVSYSDRSVVEDQPDFFVEVFKVNPEYMTKEELEQFEAFKKGKTVAKRSVGRPKKAKRQLTPAQEARYAKLRTPEYRAAQSRKLKAYWKKKRAAEGKA